MTKGKCLSCGTLIAQVHYVSVNVKPGLLAESAWKGVIYLCSSCHAVLGVGIDPVALETDTVAEMCVHVDKVAANLNAILAQVGEILNRKG
jgi:hypothetical protein